MSYDDFGVNSSYVADDSAILFPRSQANLKVSAMETKNLIGMLAGFAHSEPVETLTFGGDRSIRQCSAAAVISSVVNCDSRNRIRSS